MIYLTGDTHSDFFRLSMKSFPEQREMGKDDCVIILGDFGGIWDGSASEKYSLDWLEQKPYKILWVDGNHENYDRLKEFETSIWNGGKVQKIRPNIFHLKRGQVFTIQGKTFFTFGGARSHDISDGILDRDDPDFRSKYYALRRSPCAMYRINHESWWKEEMPTLRERLEGKRNLRKHGWKVDYILSHDTTTFCQDDLGNGLYTPNELNSYLDSIANKTDFGHWYFGHYHTDCDIGDKYTCLFREILRIC